MNDSNYIYCTECGERIDLDAKRCVKFCPYCGESLTTQKSTTKTVNVNKTYRKIDDAKIIEAEQKRDIRAMELMADVAKAKQATRAAMSKNLPEVLAFLMAFGMLFGGVFLSQKSEKEARQTQIEQEALGNISAGASSSYLEKKYSAVVEELKTRGFINITLIDLDDAKLLKGNKDTVESISINGDRSFSSTDYYPPDAQIIIRYH